MEAITLLLFLGGVWVVFAIGMFSWNLLQENHEHAERLALLPLEDNWNDSTSKAAAPRNNGAGDRNERKGESV